MSPSSARGSKSQKPRKRGKKAVKGPNTAEVVEALNHRLRRDVLRWIHDNGNEPTSPVSLSKTLGEDLSSVSYHVTVLLQKKALTQAGTRQRRGAMEHFYVSTVLDNEIAMSVLEKTRKTDQSSPKRRKAS